jgi:hypothetical protein
MVDNMLALSMSGCANCWAGRWPDEKHGVGPTSSASDGPVNKSVTMYKRGLVLWGTIIAVFYDEVYVKI